MKGKEEAVKTPDEIFNDVFSRAVELGNKVADEDKKADLWDIADGLLAGAVEYWLYTRQPCGKAQCEDCAPISTAEGRFAEMQKLIRHFAEDSDYYHSPTDVNVGSA